MPDAITTIPTAGPSVSVNINASSGPPPMPAYDPELGLKRRDIHIRPLRTAISKAAGSLKQIRQGAIGRGRPFEDEGAMRREYVRAFGHLLVERGGRHLPLVRMDQETDLYRLHPNEWLALPEVVELRRLFDQEAAARVVTGAMPSASSSRSSTSNTSHKSIKLGPCQPDLMTVRVGRREQGKFSYLSAIGELKYDKATTTDVEREGQLLEAMCQIIWHMRCGSSLHGLRMGVLIVNGSYKRFFLIDRDTLAIEVVAPAPAGDDHQSADGTGAIDPDVVTAGARPLIDLAQRTPVATRTRARGGLAAAGETRVVQLLRAGMTDPDCRRLCTLPHNIFSSAPTSASSPGGSDDADTDDGDISEEDDDKDDNGTPLVGFDMAALTRLMHFWAEGLARASAIPKDRPIGPELQQLGLPQSGATPAAQALGTATVPATAPAPATDVWQMQCTAVPLDAPTIGQEGKLKHEWSAKHWANVKRKRKHGGESNAGGNDGRDGDEDEDEDEDGDGRGGRDGRGQGHGCQGADGGTGRGGSTRPGRGTGHEQGQGRGQGQGGQTVRRGGMLSESPLVEAGDHGASVHDPGSRSAIRDWLGAVAITTDKQTLEELLDNDANLPRRSSPSPAAITSPCISQAHPAGAPAKILTEEVLSSPGPDTAMDFGPDDMSDADSYNARKRALQHAHQLLSAITSTGLGFRLVSPEEMDGMIVVPAGEAPVAGDVCAPADTVLLADEAGTAEKAEPGPGTNTDTASSSSATLRTPISAVFPAGVALPAGDHKARGKTETTGRTGTTKMTGMEGIKKAQEAILDADGGYADEAGGMA